MLNPSINQLLNLLNSVAEGIYCVDLFGRCTFCNSRCLEILRFDSDSDLIGKNMHDLIHHHKRDGTIYKIEDCKIYQAYNFDRKIHVCDEVFFRKDGTKFEVEYRSHPIREGNSIIGAVVTFSDVSLQRVAASNVAKLARIVESSHDAIIGRDLKGRITSWNKGAERIYGYESGETLGRKIASVVLPVDRKNEETEILRAIRTGDELTQFKVLRRRKDGELIDISLTISPVLDANEQLVGFSSVERDITEFRKSQDAVLRAMTAADRAKAIASKANQSRAEFFANVSHELRTPMNAILGMLNLALEENTDTSIGDYLSLARDSANTLLGLVNELLDFAKIESGNFDIRNEEFDLRDAIDLSAKTLAPLASEKGLELLCEIDSGIPLKVVGDGRRLQQVLTNLLSNACKFTEKGEIIVGTQIIRQLPTEARLRFFVRDTGVGIAQRDKKNILLPFQQADMSSTRKKQGTGLGLSICKELVLLMGGKLNLESQLGQGSKFWFDLSLPIADRSSPSDQLPSELVKDLKILIVDDNPTNLQMLEKTFSSWAMQPIVAGDAQQALNVINKQDKNGLEFSMILVDCLMPKVDGFELAEQISKQMGEECPPIVMMQSASDISLHSDRKASAPVRQYITKPVSQSQLLNTVVGVLDLYSDLPIDNVPGLKFEPKNHPPVRYLRILLVEDLPANQKVAKIILEKRGHQVVVANNGRNAIDLCLSFDGSFDVILMDVQMPVMDGLQATAAIRTMENPDLAEIPIIAMTAHAMKGDRETCLAAGMDAYMSKPLDAQQLVSLTESIAESTCSESKSETPGNNERVTVDETNQAKTEEQFPSRTFKLVDTESLLKRLGDDRDLLNEFAEIFLCDSPNLMKQIEEAIRNENYSQLERSAHALKGLMLNFGAEPCVDIALTLEEAGRNGSVKSTRNAFPKLKGLFSQLCDELTQLLKD